MKVRYFILACLIFFAGCTNKVDNVENETFDIVTSFYPVYVFTSNIVKDVPNVTVTNMSNEHLGCLHNYQLSTADMKMINDADAFIINGAGLEEFLEKVYDAKEESEVIDSSENVELLSEEFSDDNNEHIWLSISNAILQTKTIGKKLAILDSENADLYLNNTNLYVKNLENLRNELRATMYESGDVKLITSHDAFPYLAKDFDFEVLAVIEKEEGEFPTSKEIQEIVELVKENNIKTIFIEKETESKASNIISSETGVKICELDVITSGNGSLDDYENRMKNNINVIKESIIGEATT